VLEKTEKKGKKKGRDRDFFFKSGKNKKVGVEREEGHRQVENTPRHHSPFFVALLLQSQLPTASRFFLSFKKSTPWVAAASQRRSSSSPWPSVSRD
jgi:hypothetical protein